MIETAIQEAQEALSNKKNETKSGMLTRLEEFLNKVPEPRELSKVEIFFLNPLNILIISFGVDWTLRGDFLTGLITSGLLALGTYFVQKNRTPFLFDKEGVPIILVGIIMIQQYCHIPDEDLRGYIFFALVLLTNLLVILTKKILKIIIKCSTKSG